MSGRLETSRFRCICIFTVCFALMLGALALSADRTGATATVTSESVGNPLTAYRPKASYDQYLDRFAGAARPPLEVDVPVWNVSSAEGDVEIVTNLGDYAGEAVLTGETGYVEWEFEVPEAGFYNIELTYYPAAGRGIAIQREIQINGEELFAGADTLVFHRVWTDEGPYIIDTAGNHIRPRQVEAPAWQTVLLRDSIRYEDEPYRFYFEEGINRLRLVALAEPMAIAGLRLLQDEVPPSYDEVARKYEAQGYRPIRDVFIKIQGEDANTRSDPSLSAVFDQGDPTVEPYHPAQIRLNSIGGHRWQYAGDWITWEFEVPEDGLYQIALKAKQDLYRGTYSTRTVLLDGEVPFRELQNVEFGYSSRYQMRVLGDADDEPFYFYLTRGRHTLTLEVSLGRVAPILKMAEESLYNLNTIYRRIIMITSGNPDPLRSYQLEKRIPGLIESLKEQIEIVGMMARDFEEVTGERGGHSAVLRDLQRLLQRMVDRPHAIPRVLAEYRDAIGSLGTWVVSTRNQPLQIDYIIVASAEQQLPRAKPTHLETLIHEIKAFAASFFHDYTGVPDISATAGLGALATQAPQRPLKVWLGSGRDQALVLKQMIEDSFTPETGIPVKLELITNMGSLLVPATIAGTGPDVALGAANMELAFRGAVVDLTQFEDFEEVAARFKRSALAPFRFRDQVFALPETQSFPMLFYRKDILAELGLDLPQTWDDVYMMIPELQKRNLEFGLGPDINTYLMFLYQKGVPIYKEDGILTNLESEAAIATFREMTDLFVVYDLPLTFDFLNRFRIGEMPIAVQDYTVFNVLSVFAPELRGEWGFAPVPGRLEPDGTINRTVPSDQNTTTGSIIMAGGMEAEAWEFLKWWTRADSQLRFGREMEALMGAAARYSTANVEALQQLPWTAEQRRQLNEQWDWVEGVPPVIGGYYVTRQFDWLFRAIVLDFQPVRDSVLDYAREIHKEIERKRLEFRLETDYEKLDPRWKELYWDHYTHLYRLDWETQVIDELERLPRYDHLGIGLPQAAGKEAQGLDVKGPAHDGEGSS